MRDEVHSKSGREVFSLDKLWTWFAEKSKCPELKRFLGKRMKAGYVMFLPFLRNERNIVFSDVEGSGFEL